MPDDSQTKVYRLEYASGLPIKGQGVRTTYIAKAPATRAARCLARYLECNVYVREYTLPSESSSEWAHTPDGSTFHRA